MLTHNPTNMDAKAVAALRAVSLIKSGMVVGLGSGSTAAHAIRFIGDRIRAEGLQIIGVPTSSVTNRLAGEVGIPLIDIPNNHGIDITIDGADEVNSSFCLIKGGGGALVREKLVAAASRELVIICDPSKIKLKLGAFPLPVTIVKFGWEATKCRLQEICPEAHLRFAGETEEPYLTDDGGYIIDLPLGVIEDPESLERQLKAITGVIDVGLFVNLATSVIVGTPDGSSHELTRNSS